MVRFTLPEDLAALDELLLKGDAWPDSRPIMTMVLVLTAPPAARRLDDAFEQAIVAMPRLRQRVVRSTWNAGPSSWVDDEAFDLAYHLRRVGAPGEGSLGEALSWASHGATDPFDTARPLWDALLVEGRADQRALVVIRAHHALADGVRAIQMMAALLDLEPTPRPQSPGPDIGPARSVLSPGVAQVVRATGRVWVTRPLRAAELSRSMVDAGLHPIRSATSTASYVRSALRTVDRADADPSPLLASRSRTRRFNAVELQLDAMKATARANQATVNDVYLTGLLGGLRKYHEAFDLPAADLAVAIPIDVDGQGKHETGNHISAAIIPGPASIEDSLLRLRVVHDLVASRREEPGLSALDHLAPTLRQVPARVAIAAMGVHARRVDLQASNLVGPPCPLYLAGQTVDRMYAFGPLPGVPVMAVMVSYDGVCTVGFTLDPAAVTDVDLFLSCVQDAFDELLGGVGPPCTRV